MLVTVDRSTKCLKFEMSYLGEIYRFFILLKFCSWLSVKIFVSVFLPGQVLYISSPAFTVLFQANAGTEHNICN
jgi:hypothetical protein